MKSYTDIEQSKKLAEILSIESADMYIYKNIFFGALSCFNGTTQVGEYVKLTDKENKAYPCWSLAALLDLMPEYINFNGHIWKFYLDHHGMYYMNADTYDIETFSSNTGILIDDVFELILKLKEKNLL
jgi:hypothetical protein